MSERRLSSSSMTPWLASFVLHQLRVEQIPPKNIVQILSRGGRFWTTSKEEDDGWMMVTDGEHSIVAHLTIDCRRYILEETQTAPPGNMRFVNYARTCVGVLESYRFIPSIALSVQKWQTRPGLQGMIAPNTVIQPVTEHIPIRQALKELQNNDRIVLGDAQEVLDNPQLFDELLLVASTATCQQEETNQNENENENSPKNKRMSQESENSDEETCIEDNVMTLKDMLSTQEDHQSPQRKKNKTGEPRRMVDMPPDLEPSDEDDVMNLKDMFATNEASKLAQGKDYDDTPVGKALSLQELEHCNEDSSDGDGILHSQDKYPTQETLVISRGEVDEETIMKPQMLGQVESSDEESCDDGVLNFKGNIYMEEGSKLLEITEESQVELQQGEDEDEDHDEEARLLTQLSMIRSLSRRPILIDASTQTSPCQCYSTTPPTPQKQPIAREITTHTSNTSKKRPIGSPVKTSSLWNRFKEQLFDDKCSVIDVLDKCPPRPLPFRLSRWLHNNLIEVNDPPSWETCRERSGTAGSSISV